MTLKTQAMINEQGHGKTDFIPVYMQKFGDVKKAPKLARRLEKVKVKPVLYHTQMSSFIAASRNYSNAVA